MFLAISDVKGGNTFSVFVPATLSSKVRMFIQNIRLPVSHCIMPPAAQVTPQDREFKVPFGNCVCC